MSLIRITVGCLLMAFGVALGTYLVVANEPKKQAVSPTPFPVYQYFVFHTDSKGEPQENTLSASAIEVKGNCIMFFRQFHVNAVICPGSMEKVVVIEVTEP